MTGNAGAPSGKRKPPPDSAAGFGAEPDAARTSADPVRPASTRAERRILDDVFGDVLPDVTQDEMDDRSDRRDDADLERWYRENRPPHHG